MNTRWEIALGYLRPPRGSFWRWEQQGEVAVWTTGKAIAFRQEMASIIERLEPQGLPRWSALLMLVAATRDNWITPGGGQTTLSELLAEITQDEDNRNELNAGGEILGLLDRVHYLGADLRGTTEGRAELAAMVFESGTPVIDSADARHIARFLASGLPPAACRLGEEIYGSEELLADLRCLKNGLRGITRETLDVRLRIGLESELQPVELEPIAFQSPRQLLAEIADDQELGQVAQLAQRVMAALTLPRRLGPVEELAVDAVSDISNRGPLDRLLLSELAQDDLTLSVRVATGEALYLQRDPPQSAPEQTRVVLLDFGLRSWGVPRLFATAVGLALAAQESHGGAIVFRSTQSGVAELDFRSRQGLRQALETLDISADARGGLPSFAGHVQQYERQHRGEITPFLVLTEAAYRDKDLQQDLRKWLHPRDVLVATVNRRGDFELRAHSPRGVRTLRTARFELSDILRPLSTERPQTPLQDPEPPRGPAALALQPFPFRLSEAARWDGSEWSVDGLGALSVTRTGCLLHWDTPGRGGRLLRSNLPARKVLWSRRQLTSRDAYALLGEPGESTIYRLRLDTIEMRCELDAITLEAPGWIPAGGEAWHFYLLSANCRRVDAIHLAEARRIASRELEPSQIHRSGRFFRSLAGKWSALTMERDQLTLTPFATPGDPISLHDGSALPAPIARTANHQLIRVDTQQPMSLEITPTTEILRESSSGGRWLVRTEPFRRKEIWDLTDGSKRPVRGKMARLLEPEIWDYVRARPLRLHVEGIASCESPTGIGLGLVHEKRVFPIQRARNSVLLELGKEQPPTSGVIRFRKPQPGPANDHALRVAEIENSRIYLDPRGMLHLQSDDPRLPEISLILHENELAGWCERAGVWGPPYFVDLPAPREPPELVYDALRGYAERI